MREKVTITFNTSHSETGTELHYEGLFTLGDASDILRYAIEKREINDRIRLMRNPTITERKMGRPRKIANPL